MTDTFRNARIATLIAEEGLGEMQAHNVVRAEIAMKNNLGRDARAADYRFGRQF